MSASPRLQLGIVAVGLSCLVAGYVAAQQQTVRDQPGAAIEKPAAQVPAIGQTDRLQSPRREYTAGFRGNQADAARTAHDVQRYIAGCLLAKNRAEVELGEFAQQNAESPQVKEFAQMIVQDHNALIQKLEQIAGNRRDRTSAEVPLTDRVRTPANRDASGQNAVDQNTVERVRGGDSAIDQLLAMDRQIVERCTQAAKEELQQKQGAEFDECFVASQIGSHMHMLAALEVIQQQGPEPLQQLAQQARPNVQKHLDDAKQLMKQLEGADATGPRAARQPATQPQR